MFTYIEREAIRRPSWARRLVARFVARGGEPLRFGFEPAELPGWLLPRGFALEHDVRFQDAAELLLSPGRARMFDASLRVAFSTRAS